jgi:adenylate cyclase
MRLRDLLVTALATLIAVAWLTVPLVERLNGFSLDMLFWTRDAMFGVRHDLPSSPVAVIALDEETFRQPAFRDLPSAMWTPQLAKVLNATIAARARVVAFDVIMPISLEKHVPGFDREFLVALNLAASEGRVILSKVQHRQKPISPFPAYSYAVGHQENIRAANLIEDSDGVIRRAPLFFRSEDLQAGGRLDPSLALEIAGRMTGARPELSPDGAVKLGDYAVPGSEAAGMYVNFDSGQQIPTYSLADLYACAQAGDGDYFRQHFADKAVLIGAALDVEDRRLTSKRLIPAPDGGGLAERCRLPIPAGFYDPSHFRDTIPGVLIHAQAVNDLVRREVLREPGLGWRLALDFLLIFGAGWITMRSPPIRAGLYVAGGAFAWALVCTFVFQHDVILPLFAPMFGSGLSFAWLLGYRFVVSDRRSRHLRQAFGYYMPASIIDRMVAAGQDPKLGGEARRMTVLFSDIKGFTEIAEGLSPSDLVRLLNAYLEEMTSIVDAHGGYVDKYVGDGIVAMFGAPIEESDHALQAVKAALECQRRLFRSRYILEILGDRELQTRIGINTGEMIVGNIGSQRRLNYTVMGDAVNLAARLEGANKLYGTSILVSEATMKACGPSVAFREIDHVRVIGRQAPVRIFEPLARREELTAEHQEIESRYALALREFRNREFGTAAAAFQALASAVPAASAFARRAMDLAVSPPPADWEGIHDLERK